MNLINSKNRNRRCDFLFKLLIFTTFFSEPVVSAHFLLNYTAVIDYIIMAFLLVVVYAYKIPNRRVYPIAKFSIFAFIFILLKSIIVDGISEVFGSNIGLYIKTLFSLIYLYVCYTIFEERKLIVSFRVWEKFLFWICCCSIITYFLYIFGFHFLFFKKEVLNYPCEQIPFVGLVHYDDNDKIRPSWLFYEPSYLGDILGFNFMMIYNYYMKFKKKKKLIVYILAIVVCGSITGVGCTVAAICVNFLLNKLGFLKKHIILPKLIMLFLVPTVLTIYATYDATNLIERGESIGGTSISTRQTRLAYGLQQINNASTYELVFGRGKNFNKLGLGVSNCYAQLLCADGLLVLILFVSIVFVLLKRTNYEFYFMIIAMNAIDLSFLPFLMLMMVVVYQFYKCNYLQHFA